jgi:ribosomal-protein-alanine N-acetyltransferase
MRITPFTLEDCSQAAQLHQTAFYTGWSQKDFENFVRDPLIFGLKIMIDNTLCAYIIWREVDQEAEIFTLVVASPLQRMGLGSQLLNHFLDQLLTRGIKKLFLEVAADNRNAQSFYLRHGFTEGGRRPNYYKREGDVLVEAFVFVKIISSDPILP